MDIQFPKLTLVALKKRCHRSIRHGSLSRTLACRHFRTWSVGLPGMEWTHCYSMLVLWLSHANFRLVH